LANIELKDLLPGKNYILQVRAKNENGEYSEWSTTYNFTAPPDTTRTLENIYQSQIGQGNGTSTTGVLKSSTFNGSLNTDFSVKTTGGKIDPIYSGNTGWAIDYAGNAIFSNVLVRGTVQANEGYIGGTTGWDITAGKIAANGNEATFFLKNPSTLANNTDVAVQFGSVFQVLKNGDLIVGDVTANSIFINSGDGFTLRIDSNVDGSNDGIYINQYNYWYTDGKFSVGNASKRMFWNGSSLTASSIIADSISVQGSSTFGGSMLVPGTLQILNSGSDIGTIFVGANKDSGKRTKITADGLSSYDSSGNLIFFTPGVSSDSAAIAGFQFDNSKMSIGTDFIIRTSPLTLGGFAGIALGSNAVTSPTSAPFYVDTSGNLSATSATIKGTINATAGYFGSGTDASKRWNISSGKIDSGSGNSYVGLSSDTAIDYAIWAGDELPASAEFSVKRDGTLKATNADISGSITATSGTFTGTIHAQGGDFTGSLKVDTGGSIYVGSSSITGQRVVMNNTGLYGYNSSNLAVFSLPITGDPTIANFKVLTTGLSSDTANLIAGTLTNNITVRGDKTGPQPAALYSTISGTSTTATTGNGFYIDDTGKFRFATGSNVISGSDGALTVTGTIRGSDVFANSAQIGGNSFGWISGSGGIFSGTKESTSYLQSGFYSNAILKIEHEVESGNVKRNVFIKKANITNVEVMPDGFTLRYTCQNSFQTGEVVSVSGVSYSLNSTGSVPYTNFNGTNLVIAYATPDEFYIRQGGVYGSYISNGVATSQTSLLAKIIGNPRSPYLELSHEVIGLEKGYEIWIPKEDTGIWSQSKFEFVGVISEIVNDKLIKLTEVSPRVIESESFSATYVNSTITTQFFTGISGASTRISIRSPYASDYDVSGITVLTSEDDRVLTTKSISPVLVSGSLKQNTYQSGSCFLELATGSEDNLLFDVKRIYVKKKTNPVDAESPFYNVSIYLTNGAQNSLNLGDNIFVANIPSNSTTFTPLNNNYFPIISKGTETVEGTLYGKVTIYADGYLDLATSTDSDEFTSYQVNSFSSTGNKITLTFTEDHRLSVGQKITIPDFNGRGYIDSGWAGEYIITEVPGLNKISYSKVYPQTIDTIIPASIVVLASSYPNLTIYNHSKNYSMWIGASSPDDAPFSIDTYGQTVKIKNLEVTGDVTGFYYDIIELDDFSGAFDGRKNTFVPKYNYKEVSIENPLKLVISLNGVTQSAFIRNREYVWHTGFLSYNGYTLDDFGSIKFSESPPPGSTINARVFPGPKVNKTSRIYPFKPIDVALG
jgi:hypothetical protein